MLTKRIIACLDIKGGKVVKGISFRNHTIVGNIIELADRYSKQGADELVLYDISASTKSSSVEKDWVSNVAKVIEIPFSVAGGINSVAEAGSILEAGADKISINTPALKNPSLIDQLVKEFGQQCVIVGIDSKTEPKGSFCWSHTGDELTARTSSRLTIDWAKEVESRGAGEIVLNCMNQDGTREGYDIQQTKTIHDIVSIPVIASGGAGHPQDFVDIFSNEAADGALAAGILHRGEYRIEDIKTTLKKENIRIRTSK